MLAAFTALLLIFVSIVLPFFHKFEFFGDHYAIFVFGDVGNRTYLAQGFHYGEMRVNYTGPGPVPRDYQWWLRLGDFSLCVEMIKPTDGI